ANKFAKRGKFCRAWLPSSAAAKLARYARRAGWRSRAIRRQSARLSWGAFDDEVDGGDCACSLFETFEAFGTTVNGDLFGVSAAIAKGSMRVVSPVSHAEVICCEKL